MWWKVDIVKFMRQLLPPMLRSPFLVAWLRALIAPLRELASWFASDREDRLEELRITPQAGVLEWVLNARLGLPVAPPTIRIDSGDVQKGLTLHKREEQVPAYLHRVEEALPSLVFLRGELAYGYTIRVYVPDTLKAKERYIAEFLNKHAAAGRRWAIEWTGEAETT